MKRIDTPLEKISSVASEESLFVGKIIIWNGSSQSSEIRNVAKKTIKPFIDALNNEIDKTKSNTKQGKGPQGLVTQMKELAELRDAGSISLKDFEEAKKKLLAS